MVALSSEEGLTLFEAALARGETPVVAVRLNIAALGRQAGQGVLPALLSRLVRAQPRRVDEGSGIRSQNWLAGVAAEDRERAVLDLVLSEVASVLGHSSPEDLPDARTFKELGFDSLGGVELRNRFIATTGLRLAATLVFDYPTPRALAGHLLAQIQANEDGATVSFDAELAVLEQRLSLMASDDATRSEVASRLLALVAEWGGDGHTEAEDDRDLFAANAEEVIDLIDREFGSPESDRGAHARD